MLQIGLAIAGDLFLDALSRDLRESHVIAVVQREADLLQRACRGDFDVLILDERFLPPALDLLPRLLNSGVGLVLIGDSLSSAYISHLVNSGIEVYLYRGDSLRPLTCPRGVDIALNSAFCKRLFLSPSAASAYSRAPHALDEQCQAVLRLLAQDKRVSAIAAELNIGKPRAYYVLGRLKKAMGATTIAGTLMQAARLGYV